MTSAPSTTAFTYDELDGILRGAGGHDGAIGMSAIDGLIAALVAAPTFVHPDEWVPLIFGGRRPRMGEGSPEERAVRTVCLPRTSSGVACDRGSGNLIRDDRWSEAPGMLRGVAVQLQGAT